jgi:hypothetical protein
LGAAGILLTAGMALAAEAPLSETRTALEQWVTTRQLIAGETSDWATEKETLQQTTALYERELQRLDEQLSGTETRNTQAEREQAELEERKEELMRAMNTLASSVAEMEGALRKLSREFPPALVNRIEPLIARLPENSQDTRLSAIERMQTVIGLLNEVEKFNEAVTLETEVKADPDGREVQVQTLYLGLGQAFFVDASGEFAGIGLSGGTGWEWQTRSELSPRIRELIAVYENRQPADFVSLPLTVR